MNSLVTIADRYFHGIGYSGISQIASEDERAVSSLLDRDSNQIMVRSNLTKLCTQMFGCRISAETFNVQHYLLHVFKMAVTLNIQRTISLE